MRVLSHGRPGRVAYGDALAWQEALLAARLAGGRDALLLLEHPPVYTLGRGADARFLGAAAERPEIDVVRVSRGGQVTYHGPGQLVGYPVLDLRGHRQDVHWYVRTLERVLIDALERFDVRAERRAGHPGVWVSGRKIASIGVAIRRWVTWHGFALNVARDVSGFAAITPCGIDGVEMTSVAAAGVTASVDDVADVVLQCFVDAFGYDAVEPLATPAFADDPAG